MTSSEIRQSFLDFFKSKQHTIAPSSSLMPDAPNLLFTNAGMNQFVPIFLGQRAPDVDKWPGVIPGLPTRAADTQKCIRAGGKHNDLEDVGLDTYHHTFFEMLGNWSFGDYFKKEAVEWAWELITGIWKFPKNRLYATVYNPDKSKGDPSDFDQEAYDHWARLFSATGLDPKVHIVNGGKKDNFWMMGETGPCGPCSEIHVDLTPQGDTHGALVNKGDARCIEIWNLVFIQFNANPDDTFSPLPARHVDTGMGFERVTGIMQNTKNFTDFTRAISNYETDIFRPIFDKLEQMSGKYYASTLPASGSEVSNLSPQIQTDIAFRVIADHIRTLSFAIADGIQPGNTDRNYVLRRILRRAVLYGRTLGFHEPFLYKLADALEETMGQVFPEIREKRKPVKAVIRSEEEAFNRTLDEGREIFESAVNELGRLKHFLKNVPAKLETAGREVIDTQQWPRPKEGDEGMWAHKIMTPIASLDLTQAALLPLFDLPTDQARKAFPTKRILVEWEKRWNALWKPTDDLIKKLEGIQDPDAAARCRQKILNGMAQIKAELPTKEDELKVFPGAVAFLLHDTYGFPIEETERMARGHGLTVEMGRYEELKEQQRARARAAQTREVIQVTQINALATKFIGFDRLTTNARIKTTVQVKERTAIVLDQTVFYAEMGGQVGDTGVIRTNDNTFGRKQFRVLNTQKIDDVFAHIIETDVDTIVWGSPAVAEYEVELAVDPERREAIQRHHTVTHALHWALHEVVSKEAMQKGSYVGPDKLTFDFSSAPLTAAQVRDVEKLVNERLLENAGVSWREVPYAEVKGRKDIMQFFGDKYGDTVRVVQIGGRAGELNGYSMELCGGTHTRATGEIGLFRIVAESAVAAGIRRIEAVAGLQAYEKSKAEAELIAQVADKVNSPVGELEKKVESLLTQQKELEKQLKAMQQKQASETARGLVAKAREVNGVRAIIENLGPADGDYLQSVADALKGEFKGIIVLGGVANNAVSLIATVSPEFTARVQAGKLIQAIAPVVGGKGGGRPDNARGGGKDTGKLDEALRKAEELVK